MKFIAKSDEEICKMLAFQGLFESILEITKQEDGVILKDCLQLMKMLLSDFNKHFIREVPVIIERLKHLINSVAYNAALEFMIEACKDKQGKLISSNQVYFSKLIKEISSIAFPCSSYQQSRTALELISLLVHNNQSLVKTLLTLQVHSWHDFLDLVCSYCIQGQESSLTFELLWSMCKTNKEVQSSAVSKITCVPGYKEDPHSVPPFNIVLNQCLEEHTNLNLLCKLLEMLILDNEVSKELATSLPIDTNSANLPQKVTTILTESLSAKKVTSLVPVTRLLIALAHNSLVGSQCLQPNLETCIPLCLEYILEDQQIPQSLCACLVGCIAMHAPHIQALVLKKIGYTGFCNTLEKLTSLQEFTKAEKQENLFLDHRTFSMPLVKQFRAASQTIKKTLLTEITQNAPDSESELAKLVQVQDKLISNLQDFRKYQPSQDTSELDTEINQLKSENMFLQSEVESLKLKLMEKDLEAKRELRGTYQAFISTQETLELTQFENLSFKRENTILKAKIHRLESELGLQTPNHSQKDFLDLQEQVKNLQADCEYLKNLNEIKENQNQELLEALGEAKTNQGVKLPKETYSQATQVTTEAPQEPLKKFQTQVMQKPCLDLLKLEEPPRAPPAQGLASLFEQESIADPFSQNEEEPFSFFSKITNSTPASNPFNF